MAPRQEGLASVGMIEALAFPRDRTLGATTTFIITIWHTARGLEWRACVTPNQVVP